MGSRTRTRGEERGPREEMKGGGDSRSFFVACYLLMQFCRFAPEALRGLTRSTEMAMARPRERLRILASSLSLVSCSSSARPKMPLFPSSPKKGEIPVYNSACPWASSADDLKSLYLSPFTAAVTTRTCTLNGFADDASKHQVRSATLSSLLVPYSSFPWLETQVAFFGNEAESSSNSYGYSPYAITVYLDWLRPLLLSKTAPKKQVVVSITGTLEETRQTLKILQVGDEHSLRKKMNTLTPSRHPCRPLLTRSRLPSAPSSTPLAQTSVGSLRLSDG